MSIFEQCRATSATLAVLAAGSITLLPTPAMASPEQSTDIAASALAATPTTQSDNRCYENLGGLTFGAGGRPVGGNPPRFKFDDSPYLGVLYDSCAGHMRLHYGGYRATHYNIRGYGNQFEVRGGDGARVFKIPISGSNPRAFGIVVQACNRGSGLAGSRCTRWSPTVWIQTGAEVVR